MSRNKTKKSSQRSSANRSLRNTQGLSVRANGHSPLQSQRIWQEIDHGIWSLNHRNHKFLYLNPVAEKILDRSYQELEADANLLTQIIHPDDRTKWLSFWPNIITQGEAILEYRIITKSGQIRCLKSKGWTVINQQGKIDHLEGIITVNCLDLPENLPNHHGFYTTASTLSNQGEMWPKSACQTLLSNVPGVIYQYVVHPDQTDQFVYISQGYQAVYEKTSEAVYQDSKLMWSGVHPDDLPAFENACQNASENLMQWQFNWRQIMPSGQIKWLSGTALPEKQDNGDVVWYGYICDITDQQLTATQLKENEELFRATFEQAAVGICHRDLQGNLVKVNQKLCEIVGYTKAELLGKSYQAINYPEDIYIDREQAQKLWEGEIKTYSVDKRYLHKNGAIVWVNLTISLVQDDRNQPQYYIVVVQDISARQRAEIALSESQHLYQVLAEASPVGIFLTDVIGNIIYVNDRYCQITGLTQSEIINNNSWINRLHPDDSDRVLTAIGQTMATHQPSQLEYRIVRPNGQITWVIGQTIPEINAQGKLINYVGTLTDINDLKEAETEIQQTKKFLESVLENLPVAVIIKEAEGLHFTFWNATAEKLIGYSAVEMLGKTDYDFFPPDQADAFAMKDREVLQSGQVLDIPEEVIQTKGGELRVLHTKKTAILDQQYKPLYLLVISEDVTEKKRAEIALLQSEKLYRTLAQNFPNSTVALFDISLRYTLIEGSELGVYGIKKELMIGKSIYDLFSVLEVQELERLYRSALNGQTIEEEINRGDRTYQLYIVPVRNEQGKIFAGLSVAHNITDRKKAEAALLKSEQRYRQIIETAREGIWQIDTNLKTVLVNRRMANMLGYTVTEMKGRSILNFIPEENWGLLHSDINRRHQTMAEQFDFKFRRKDGSDFWAIVSTNPVFDEHGEYAGTLAMLTDISDRKRTESALQQSEAQSRELARRTELLNQISNQIRNSLDVDTIIDNTVRSVRDLLQIDRANFMWYRGNRELPVWQIVKEAKPDDLPSLLGDYSITLMGSLEQLLHQGKPLRVDRVSELTDETLKELLLKSNYTCLLNVPFPTQSGELGALSIGHCSGDRPWTDEEVDLMEAVAVQLAIAINQAELYHQATESARIATAKSQELEQTMHQLQKAQANLIQAEKMSSLGQMVAGVAHEINNPVNFIYGNIAPAREYIDDLFRLIVLYQEANLNLPRETVEEIEEIELDYIIEDLPKLINSMQIGAERIKEIVKSLRVFSRLDEAEMKAVSLHENIDSTLMILQNRLKEKPDRPAIQIIKNYTELPLIECYAGQLNQVFMNLLSNSLDAVEETNRGKSYQEIEQSPNEITITTAVKNNQAEVRIKDNGKGMTPEVISRVFDPFFTTKPVGKGTGLGLSISYQIVVEKHNGTMRCQSELGKGTEFIIEIPLKQ